MTNQNQTQSVIVFKVLDYDLALPIEAVLKVVRRSALTASRELNAMGLIQLGRHMLRIVDLHHRVTAMAAASLSDSPPFWVITRSPGGELLGLPVDQPPDLISVSPEQLRSLPPASPVSGSFENMASHVVVLPQTERTQTIILLDLARILSPPTRAAIALPHGEV